MSTPSISSQPSDLKPLLSNLSSLKSTLSIEPSADGSATEQRGWWRRRRDGRRRLASPSPPSLFALAPCVAELRACLSLATPMCLQNILYLSNALVLIVVIGHASSKQEGSEGGERLLAAAVLGTSLFNVTGLSIAIGLSTALETLAAQAYGARAYPLLGELLQRALAVQAAAVAVVGAVWFLLLDAALAALGQEPRLASAAASFVRECYPGLALTACAECVRRYLVAQGVVAVPALAAAASAATSAATAVALVPRKGLSGAAAAVNLSAAASLGALVAGSSWHHARCRRSGAAAVAAAVDDDDVERRRSEGAEVGENRLTWAGWSLSSALSGWGPYLRVAAPSAAQVCLEWWTFECQILMAALISDAAVAATGIGFQTVTICYSLPLGMAAASATRVGHELGAGSPEGAARAAAVSTLATLAASSAVGAALFGARGPWARLFTSDGAVLGVARVIMPWTAVAVVGDGVNGALGGCVRGAGRQAAAAALNVVFYWVLGIPFSALLAFRVGMGVEGLWTGLAATTVVQALAMATMVSRFDWRREAEAAKARVAASSSSDSAPNRPPEGLIGTDVASSSSGRQQSSPSTPSRPKPPPPSSSSSSGRQQPPPSTPSRPPSASSPVAPSPSVHGSSPSPQQQRQRAQIPASPFRTN